MNERVSEQAKDCEEQRGKIETNTKTRIKSRKSENKKNKKRKQTSCFGWCVSTQQQ